MASSIAMAMVDAGQVPLATAKAVVRQQERSKALAELKVRVRLALTRAQSSGLPKDWKNYLQLKEKLPYHLRRYF